MRCARSWRPPGRSRTAVLCMLLLGWLSAAGRAQDVWVTGQPASLAFLEQVLSTRGFRQRPPAALGPGQSWLSPDGRRVTNLDWRPPAASVAALSDHPEKVERRGMLFSGGLTRSRPVRFQYYHLGALAGEAPQLALLVSNPGSRPARLHMVCAVGPPSLDYFSSGQGNNVAWFERQLSGEGEFLELGPGQSRVIFRQPMPPGYVVSGTLGLTLLDGPPLQFGLLAVPDQKEPLSWNNLLKKEDVHSRGFYPVATQRLRRRHQVGQPSETRIAVGALRQETFSGVRELRGDYGVVYEMEIELHNPGRQEATVAILFNPRGGAATATFLWEDRVLKVPLTQAMQERPLAEIELTAGESRTLRLSTIPEGASSYPVRLILRDKTGMVSL
jgi:hypothetical protein